jgi:hypothetical protein
MTTHATSPVNCKTCGSEINDSINGSNFHEGECGLCEYRRYRSAPDVLRACTQLVEMAKSVLHNWENGRLDVAVQNLGLLAAEAKAVLSQAYGDSA